MPTQTKIATTDGQIQRFSEYALSNCCVRRNPPHGSTLPHTILRSNDHQTFGLDPVISYGGVTKRRPCLLPSPQCGVSTPPSQYFGTTRHPHSTPSNTPHNDPAWAAQYHHHHHHHHQPISNPKLAGRSGRREGRGVFFLQGRFLDEQLLDLVLEGEDLALEL